MKKIFKKLTKKTILAILAILVIGIPLLYLTVLNQKEAAAWFNESWRYRKALNITNSSGSNLTDFQVSFTIDTSDTSKFQSDCDDIRITDTDGNLLNYWIEKLSSSVCGTSTTKIWTKVSSVSTTGTTIYVYYGNSSAASYQDGTQTFIYFDNFDDNSIDTNLWTEVDPGSYISETGGKLVFSGERLAWDEMVYMTASMARGNTVMEYDYQRTSSNPTTYNAMMGGWKDDGAGASYDNLVYGYYNRGYQCTTCPTSVFEDGTNTMVSGSDNFVKDTWYKARVRMKSAGGAYFDESSDGGITWTNSYTSSLSVESNLHPAWIFYNGTHNIDNFFVRKDATTAPTNSLASEEQNSGPVGYWKVDEGLGTIAYDSTSSKNNGTITGSTWTTEASCKAGKCLSLDGSDDVITVTQAAPINLTSKTAYTISAWFNADSDGEGDAGQIIQKGATTYIRVSGQSGSNLNIDASLDLATTDATISLTAPVTTGTWNHVELIYTDDASDEITIYVNGKNMGTSTNGVGSPATDSNNLLIGGTTTANFDGFIDDVRIYSYARTPAQIKTDYISRGANSGSAVSVGTDSVLNSWFSPDWLYRKTLTITLPASFASDRTNALTGFSIDTSTLITAGKLQSSCQDLRFVSPSGKVLTYYIAANCNTTATKILIYADLIPKNATTYIVNMYYGNPTVITGSSSANFPSYLYQGLTGYWNMNEASANSCTGGANDSCNIYADGNDGAWNGNTANTTGKYGNGTSYDGTGDYINGFDSSISPVGSRTICAWINPADTSRRGIVGTRSASAATGFVFTANLTTAGNLTYFHTGGTVYTVAAGITSSVWQHACVTLNTSTATAQMYVNGAAVGSPQTSFSTESTSAFNGIIGAEQDGSSTELFNGTIDDVRIYNRTLSSTEISQLYNDSTSTILTATNLSFATATASEEQSFSPVAWWKFDEGQGITANNSSSGGASYNGTMSGFASPATSTSGWTQSGKFGKALIFDGSDDSLNVGNPLGSSSSGVKTVSAWVYPTAASNGYIITNIDAASNGFSILFNSDKTLGIAWTSTANAVQTTEALTLNTWSYITAVYNTGTTGGQIYINGRLSKAGNLSTEQTTTNKIKVGSRWVTANSGTAIDFTGIIDEVKVYNYALTASQILKDYNKGLSLQLGAAGSNTAYQKGAANQEYCIPGDPSACAAPVGRWDFEERSGTAVNDASGNANTGSWNGTGSHWTAGKVGRGGNFNGTNDYISITDGLNIGDNNFTVSGWFNGSTLNGFFMSKRDGDATNIEWNLQITSTPYFAIFTSNGLSSNVVTSSVTISANKWYHLAAVYDKTNSQIRLYLNGTQVGTTTKTIAVTDSASPYRIGARHSTPEVFFSGSIDEVKIYNYARSAAQVAWDYNQGVPVGYFKFDECQGSIAHDSSVNRNDGTITVGASPDLGTCNTASTSWGNGATGKINSSLNFDGTDDYITTSASSPLAAASQTTKNISWGGWFYPATSAASKTLLEKASEFQLTTDSNSMPLCGVYYSAAFHNSAAPTTALTLSAWNHVLCTYDGTNINTYLNGQLIKRSSETNNVTAASSIIYFGETSGGANFYSGRIDEVKIFNYALTAEQVKNEYNNGMAINFGPLTGAP